MNSFFSIINLKTNSYSSETLVVGLLSVSAGMVYYAYSKNKLKLLKKLVKEQQLEIFTEDMLLQLKSSVDSFNNKAEKPQSSLDLNGLFSPTYFSYLNQYSNGLLQFSEPIKVSFLFDANKFSQYYLNFVGEPIEAAKRKGQILFIKN